MARADDKAWRQVNRNGDLTRHLDAVATRLADRMQRISDTRGGTAKFTTRSGHRPGGRAYADIVMDNPFEEFGTEDTPRIGAMREVMRGG